MHIFRITAKYVSCSFFHTPALESHNHWGTVCFISPCVPYSSLEHSTCEARGQTSYNYAYFWQQTSWETPILEKWGGGGPLRQSRSGSDTTRGRSLERRASSRESSRSRSSGRQSVPRSRSKSPSPSPRRAAVSRSKSSNSPKAPKSRRLPVPRRQLHANLQLLAPKPRRRLRFPLQESRTHSNQRRLNRKHLVRGGKLPRNRSQQLQGPP